MLKASSEGRTGWTAARTDREPARAPRVLRLVLLGTASLAFAFLAGFAVYVASLDRSEHRPGASTDGIVALTGGSERIGDAIDLLSQGFARRLLITGVNQRTSRDEIARLNPAKRDLVACCVDLDYRARDTIGNAFEIRRWAHQNDFQSLIVVTSNYHMPRTLAELDHASPEIRKIPYPVVTSQVDAAAWWHRVATARLLFAEYTKYLAVLVRTRLVATAVANDLPIGAGSRLREPEIRLVGPAGEKLGSPGLQPVAEPVEAR